jgi:hypothetical protein
MAGRGAKVHDWATVEDVILRRHTNLRIDRAPERNKLVVRDLSSYMEVPRTWRCA